MTHTPGARRSVWLALTMCTVFALAACGTDPASPTDDPKAKPDAGGEVLPDDTSDAGSTGMTGDAGTKVKRVLALVGVAPGTLEFGDQATLQFQLVQTEIGPVKDAVIQFSMGDDPGGSKLSVTSATTDANGMVKVVFTAGNVAGNAQVVADPGSSMKGEPVKVGATIVAPVHVISVSGSQLTLAAGRTDSVQIKVVDGTGVAVAAAKISVELSNGDKKTALVNGASTLPVTLTTKLDGTGALSVTAPATVAQSFTFDLELKDPYAASSGHLLVKVNPRAKDGEACNVSADCVTGTICDGGTCTKDKACSSNSDCATGYTCTPDGQCVKSTGVNCGDTTDCKTAGTYCNPSIGQCVLGCEDDTQCSSGKLCDVNNNTCVSPTQKSCTDDSECPNNYVCNGKSCVAAPTGGNCTDSSTCAKGQYCEPNLGKCTNGCDDNSQCTSGFCSVDTHACLATAPCEDDSECKTGEVCNTATGVCGAAPPVIYDVTTDWTQVEHHFHVTGLLPSNIASALSTINTGFGYANTIINGQVGNLLPGLVPQFIKDAISKAVNGAIQDYIPEWLKDAVRIGTNVSGIINEFTVKSEMHFDLNPDKSTLKGHDDWKTLVYHWYTPDCPAPSLGQQPDPCSEVEIDMVNEAIAPGPSNFTATVKGTVLTIGVHNLTLKYGKAVNLLINYIAQQITGEDTLAKAAQSIVDCASVNEFVQDTAASILPDDFASLATSINITSTCQSAINSAANTVTSAINNLAPIATPIQLSGTATITLDPGNTGDTADHLVNGVWNGSFNNSAPKNGLATWNAER